MGYEKNISLDATLVYAAMRGLFVPCAMGLGMKPDEAFGRADWLKKQSGAYIEKVSNKVVELEESGSEGRLKCNASST